ncbi:hypothetical protein WS9_007485 [Paraclostridium sordellii 8483]|uniref:hypothetical protein n=1 Tax=Paraclostridium sordellii TaxID=1505 RepID=UPI0002F6EEF7|nr:hypothetical protein [Paeniclostridium sordellii]TAN67674.1 hypothetical protein WS9_007485 [Paeniclostridium sordellii 8483]
MARLKKGEKKKVQMTIRIDPDIAERLKSIDKYSAKVGSFISKGIDEYYKFLNENSCKNEDEKYNFLEILENEELRLKYIEELKKLNDYYDNEVFFKFHQDLYNLHKSGNNEILRCLELVNKKLNNIKEIIDD